MRRFTRVLLATLGAAGAAAAGLRVPPRMPRGTSQRPVSLGRTDLPPDLPLPVRRHLEAATGTATLPRVETAVAWGRGSLAGPGSLTAPVAWRLDLIAGHAFVWSAHATWFGRPVRTLSLTRWPGAEPSGAPDEAALLWAWTLALAPSRLVEDPRVRWERGDADTARVHVPAGGTALALDLRFDPETGRLSHASTPDAAFMATWEGARREAGYMTPARIDGAAHGRPFQLTLDGWAPNVDVLDRMIATERKPHQK